MGQHKNNPIAQLAKEGKLPPKPVEMSKKERDLRLRMAVTEEVAKRTHLPVEMFYPYSLWI
jgi:hypothetical protein